MLQSYTHTHTIVCLWFWTSDWLFWSIQLDPSFFPSQVVPNAFYFHSLSLCVCMCVALHYVPIKYDDCSLRDPCPFRCYLGMCTCLYLCWGPNGSPLLVCTRACSFCSITGTSSVSVKHNLGLLSSGSFLSSHNPRVSSCPYSSPQIAVRFQRLRYFLFYSTRCQVFRCIILLSLLVSLWVYVSLSIHLCRLYISGFHIQLEVMLFLSGRGHFIFSVASHSVYCSEARFTPKLVRIRYSKQFTSVIVLNSRPLLMAAALIRQSSSPDCCSIGIHVLLPMPPVVQYTQDWNSGVGLLCGPVWNVSAWSGLFYFLFLLFPVSYSVFDQSPPRVSDRLWSWTCQHGVRLKFCAWLMHRLTTGPGPHALFVWLHLPGAIRMSNLSRSVCTIVPTAQLLHAPFGLVRRSNEIGWPFHLANDHSVFVLDSAALVARLLHLHVWMNEWMYACIYTHTRMCASLPWISLLFSPSVVLLRLGDHCHHHPAVTTTHTFSLHYAFSHNLAVLYIHLFYLLVVFLLQSHNNHNRQSVCKCIKCCIKSNF